MTQQLHSDVLAAGKEPPRARVRLRIVSVVAAACLVAAGVAGIRAWQMRSPTAVPPAAPTTKVIHPLLLLGRGSFSLDRSAAVARNTADVFFAHWADLSSGGVYFMRPQWLVDPRTGAYEPADGGGPGGNGLASWVQDNPRLQLGPPTSVTVGGDPAVQFTMLGTHGTGPYVWMCPDVKHEDCFSAPDGGLGYVTIVTHNGSDYVLVGGAATPAAQKIAIPRYRQTLRSWVWGE